MKHLHLALVFFLAFVILHSVANAQPIDTLAYCPHWELVQNSETTTSLFVTFLSPEEYVDSIKVFVRFYRENGMPLEDRVVKLYQANYSYTEVTTTSGGLSMGGYVYFVLRPRQTAKLVLTTQNFEKPLSFGYAALGWKHYTDQITIAKFLAWGTVKSVSGGFISRSGSEASISVNGGLSFELRACR